MTLHMPAAMMKEMVDHALTDLPNECCGLITGKDSDAEKDVLTKKTLEEGKPEAAVAKIVEGRIGAFFKEIVLLEQESVFESKKSVKQVLSETGTTVKRFVRFEVGA